MVVAACSPSAVAYCVATQMDAANLTPREDEVGSSPAFSHLYRVTVEEYGSGTLSVLIA